MLRSLFAVILAVLVGVTAAQIVERVGVEAFASGDAAGTLSPAHQLVLVASWGAGAFLAASLALLIGRRWAPLGWLTATSMLLLAVISAVSSPQAMTLIVGGAVATFGAGFGAIKLLRATNVFPVKPKNPGLF